MMCPSPTVEEMVTRFPFRTLESYVQKLIDYAPITWDLEIIPGVPYDCTQDYLQRKHWIWCWRWAEAATAYLQAIPGRDDCEC